MREIVLIGGGGHCKSVIDVIEQAGDFRIAGIVDKRKAPNSDVLGYPVIGDDSDIVSLAKRYRYALVTVGQIRSSSARIELFNLVAKAGFILPSVISPSAYVSKHAFIGVGTVIMHDSVVNANTTIGDNCIINSKALIEHDCKIFEHCHVSTNATINGGVVVESGCFIGSGSVTKESITIRKNSFIKAGSIVS